MSLIVGGFEMTLWTMPCVVASRSSCSNGAAVSTMRRVSGQRSAKRAHTSIPFGRGIIKSVITAAMVEPVTACRAHASRGSVSATGSCPQNFTTSATS